MHKRVFGNLQSFEGDQICTLTIGTPASVHPLRYNTRCSHCNGNAIMSHEELRRPHARCPSSVCGTDRVREQLADTPVKMRARETAEERRKQREHDEALERTKIEAEQQLLDTHRKLLKVARENLTRFRDDQLFVSDSVKQARMTPDEASAYNQAEVQRFNVLCPEYGQRYRNSANFDSIASYLAANNVRIADAQTVRAAFERLKTAGVLIPNPTPAPTPTTAPKPSPIPAPTAAEKPAAPPNGSEIGVDVNTGEPRRYSAREVRAMSADEYRRAFKIVRADLEPTF